MLVSNPLCENRHMSAVEVPLAGLGRGTGFPPSVQELFAVENSPNAATFRSNSLPGWEIPAVVGSTTTMSLPVAAVVELFRIITSSEGFGVATTSDTTFEAVPVGFWICTETFPAIATSAAVTGAVHWRVVEHVVVLAVPPMSIVEPGPGLDGTNPLPSTRSVKPCAAPAYTLEGCRVRIFTPVEMLTFATPDCVGSSELMATT